MLTMRLFRHRGSTNSKRVMVSALHFIRASLSTTQFIAVIKFGLSNREYVLLHDDAT